MYPPVQFHNLKFGIREVTAFVGHSFADDDKPVIEQLTQVLTKLGVRCDSGLRAEAVSVSAKVRERIAAAELFVGIFTRRDKIKNGVYSTSSWVVEEKAAAIAAGKNLLLFVEEGVEEFGGLQGDYEYVPFNRDNFGPAIIRAIDYVLSITSVPFQVTVEGPNKVSIKVGGQKSVSDQLEDLRRFVAANPTNTQARLSLADMIAKTGDSMAAKSEFMKVLADHPADHNVHHQYAHFLENRGDLAAALVEYQYALDLNPTDYKNNRCYGKCLYRHAKTLHPDVVRQSTLNKAKRVLERASAIGGDSCKAQIEGDLFIVNEALQECYASNVDA